MRSNETAHIVLCVRHPVPLVQCPFLSDTLYKLYFFFVVLHPLLGGLGRSLGIATGYGLDGPGIESWWGRDFPPVQTGPGVHPTSCTMGTGSFLGGKEQPGHDTEPSSLSSAMVKKE